MVTQLKLGDIAVDVVLKDIKNVHLSVYPPTGRVRISAPSRMSLDTIRVFAISKLGWIKQQQTKLREQEREDAARVSGPRKPLRLGKALPAQDRSRDDAAPTVELKHSTLILRCVPERMTTQRQAIVAGVVSRAAQELRCRL